MPSQCSRKGNCCCHRIDNSAVEGKQVNPWYRNEVRPECNSKERRRHRPSSASNYLVKAQVEPQQAHFANHTATAEHCHSKRQRMNSQSGQSCSRNVDAEVNHTILIETDPNWERLANRNSTKYHKGMRASRTTKYESNRTHRQTVNGSSDHRTSHPTVEQSSVIDSDRIDCRTGECRGQSDSTHRQSDGQTVSSGVQIFEHDTTRHKSNCRLKRQRTGQMSQWLDGAERSESNSVTHQVQHSNGTRYTPNDQSTRKNQRKHFTGRICTATYLRIMARLYGPTKWSLTAFHGSKTGGTVADASQSKNILPQYFLNELYDSPTLAICKFMAKIIHSCE